MDNNPLKVGVVGVGYLGRFHALKYQMLPPADLVGVVDLDDARASSVASECGINPCKASDLIGRVDAVSIVVPTSLHFKLAEMFLKAGVHVMLEKPITATLDEADRLINLAAENNLVLQVGHLERFNPVMQAAAPYLGKPLFIEASRINTFPQRGLDVDVVLDLMIHDLDIILHLVGEMPVTVSAVGVPVVTPLVDIANARLEFENGCVANVTASRVSETSVRKIRIFQEDGCLAVDFKDRTVRIVRRVQDGPSGQPETKTSELEVQPGDSLEAELASFLNAITTETKPKVSGEDGRKALELAKIIQTDISSKSHLWPEYAKKT